MGCTASKVSAGVDQLLDEIITESSDKVLNFLVLLLAETKDKKTKELLSRKMEDNKTGLTNTPIRPHP